MTATQHPIKNDLGPKMLSSKHTVPQLPYDRAALEPVIDSQSILLHHDEHHAGYVAKLNAAIDDHPSLQTRSALRLLLNPIKLPLKLRVALVQRYSGSAMPRAMRPEFLSSHPADASRVKQIQQIQQLLPTVMPLYVAANQAWTTYDRKAEPAIQARFRTCVLMPDSKCKTFSPDRHGPVS